ncbi:TetR/AcrR family transcriptional regulator [Aquimarina agarilytica]|uniref:TetR/AcrR family transcriptional regulator n=1 Tax=Aquimarina agarilytica TaxID=1087449 RepID=UPI000289318E|nr:TetR/AcrR family transcriptional regulator [Aquimarina agarilytica]
MSKKNEIILLADSLIRQRGYNSFSFYDISEKVGIKTSSIHYHFPSKSDLGIAVIDNHINNLKDLIKKVEQETPLDKLDQFLAIYQIIRQKNKICLIGSLASDLNTLDPRVQDKLKVFSNLMLVWVSNFLEEGKKNKTFNFYGSSRTKALMIITNMLASLQISRLTGTNDFDIVKSTIKQELLNEKKNEQRN